MGYFYLDAKIITKKDQSAVAKAAYTSNEALYSERDEEIKKYKTRTVKPESFILAPSHAPDWVYDRETLVNEIEKVEKQYNSQLLREIVVALPVDLKNEDQTTLIREYVQENFVSDGMVADVSIHRDQEHNPHAHILLTLRPFNEDGTWWKNKSKKEYILDEDGNNVLDKNGKKKTRKVDLTGWNSKEKLLEWREKYAEKINEYYRLKGIKKSVSHLSYEAQGKEVKAKQRLTRSEFYIEKKAKNEALIKNEDYVPVTTYGKINKEIEEYNKEIIEIQRQIAELEKQKHNVIQIDVTKFEDIRNNYKLASGEFEAIQFVKKRQKVSYVDFSSSQKTIDSLSFWKKSIDKKMRGLEREEEVLKTVRDMYQKGNDNIQRYGFSKSNFVDMFNERMLTLNDKYGKLTKEVSQYKESFRFAKIAHDIQKDLLNKEFEFLYPKYKDIISVDSFEMNEIKNKYVEAFKQENKLLNVIPELEAYESFNTKHEQEFRNEIWETVMNYRNQSKTHFTLPKKLDSLEKSYLELVKNSSFNSQDNLNEIYDKAVQYLTFKRELNFLDKQYEDTRNKMFNSLVQLYGEHQKDVIEKIPDRIKSLLLEQFLKERNVNELKDDLEAVDWKIRQRKIEDQWNKNGETYNELPQNTSMGGILSDLIESAKQNEGKFDDLEAKRKRAKRRLKKLTKEEILEMEK